jgi:ABC-type oligopeptide transport system ATPase subunit
VARALAVDPDFIVADEPVSRLDVSIQAQVINLLRGLQKEWDLTYLFISHDLSVVKYISDRVGGDVPGVMVEMAPSEELYANPCTPTPRRSLRGPRPRTRRRAGPRAHGPRRRRAEPGEPAERLPLQDPLPLRHRRPAPARSPCGAR